MAPTDRALASGLLGFVAIVVTIALLYTLFYPAVISVHDTSLAATSNTQAQNVINERLTIFQNILFFGILLFMIFIIGRSVFESRRGL